MLKEKAGDLDIPLARLLLVRKCQHKGLMAPEPGAFLLPEHLAEAEVYWERELIAQLPGGPLPDWKIVVEELAGALKAFFSGEMGSRAGLLPV